MAQVNKLANTAKDTLAKKEEAVPAPSTFVFPQEAAEALSYVNPTMGGLPFETLVWYIKNGKTNARNIGGVEYTGGLATSSLSDCDFQVMTITGDIKDVNSAFTDDTKVNINSTGQSYFATDQQTITIAPVTHRKRWVEGRSHTQVLCLQDLIPGEGIYCWAILSARGYQSSILLDALSGVASGTNAERKDLGNPPINFFWHVVGMPAIPEFRPVGKRETSIITPVKAGIFNNDLRSAYIGNDLAKEIGVIAQLEDVLIWKDAWKDEDKQENKLPFKSLEDDRTPFSNGIPF